MLLGDAQSPSARLPWRIKLWRQCPIFVCPQHGTGFTHGSYNFELVVDFWKNLCTFELDYGNGSKL